jgi:Putative addiction module component
MLIYEKTTGCYIMQNTIEIRHLSREEKLKVMEALWDDLSKEDAQVESPEWHQKALQETDHRLKSGQENILDWHDAKKELRERFE